jgi:hypothetical protein
MKMDFLTQGLFWGVVVILFGISILLKAMFHIDIPFFRILFGLVVIYWGVCMLTGWHGHHYSGGSRAIFTESTVSANESNKEFSVVFGKNTVDLTSLQPSDKFMRVESNTVFGDTLLIIDPAVPAKIKVSTAFAHASVPNGNETSFGELVYTTKDYKEGANSLIIEANVVFGNLKIVNK